jgi:hypothetical protein
VASIRPVAHPDRVDELEQSGQVDLPSARLSTEVSVGILEIRAALFASEVVGEHEELGPAILDPCLIDKAPRSKACKATQLGEQPMLGCLFSRRQP